MRPSHLNLRLRLTLWYIAILTLVMGISSVTVYVSFKENWEKSINRQQEQDFSTVESFLLLSTQGDGAYGLLQSDIMFIVEENGQVVCYSTSMYRCTDLRFLFQEPQAFLQDGVWRPNPQLVYALRSTYMTVGYHYYLTTVALNIAPMRQHLSALIVILSLAFIGGLAAAAVCGFWLADRALSPLGRMAEKARRITADRLSERLPIENHSDELGRLATVFNEMFDRLEKSFEQLAAFTADVSHELRTPLTAIRSVGEVALRMDPDVSRYRDAIGSMLEEADRLAATVDTLLILARAESGRASRSPVPIALDALIRSVLDTLQVLAEEKEQSICFDSPDSIFCLMDEHTMRQVLINVLHNAIQFTPFRGRIQVRVRRSVADRAAMEIIDQAQAIPAEEREKVFARFYRVETDRGRTTGGIGLGLAIAKHAVESNGGTIAFVEHDGSGNCCRIEMPTL